MPIRSTQMGLTSQTSSCCQKSPPLCGDNFAGTRNGLSVVVGGGGDVERWFIHRCDLEPVATVRLVVTYVRPAYVVEHSTIISICTLDYPVF